MRESAALRFLYGTVPGRAVLKLLVQPGVSRAAGCFLSSGASRWIVPLFVRKHNIDLSDVDLPRGGFSSFNAFFARKRRTSVGLSGGCDRVISPCDGLLSAVKIWDNTVLRIKNTEFTLADLLKDRRLAGRFRGGTALIFRLTPAHYHRYCQAAEGKVAFHRRIEGKLHCVRPIALRTFPVFAQNSREYQALETEAFGTVIQMEVGALLVGKIRNEPLRSEDGRVRAGQEKGCFEFGGSTIILLFQKNAVRLDGKLFERKNGDGEIPVRMGETVAVRRDFPGSLGV